MITVGLIDDGIELNKKLDIEKYIEITSDLKIKEDKILKSLHGKVCAEIIKKYYSKAKFISIKALGDRMKGSKEQLIKAIEWCIDNKIKVINMSLGTINYKDFESIKEVINRAYDEGIIIIAACNNRNIFTYPASLSNVIGVNSSENLKEGEYIYNLYPLDGIEITACGTHKLIFEDRITGSCNSYAAPMITAKVCEIVEKYPNITLEEVKIKLYENAINYKKGTLRVNNYKNIDWINNDTLIYMRNKDRINIEQDIEEINKDNYFVRNKNSIIIDDEYESCNYKLTYPSENIKFWHPSIIETFFKNALKKVLDVPLIVVYGCCDSKMIQVLDTLTSKFKKDGYNAVCSYTKAIGILYGMEYIPIGKEDTADKLKEKVEALYKVYDCDIIILGIAIKEGEFNNISKNNKVLEPDKFILLFDKYQFEEVDDIVEIKKKKPLIITSEKTLKKGYKEDVFLYKELNLFYKKLLNMLLKV